MAGKTVLITGANNGIGFATATALATRGDEIVMVCRDADRAASAVAHVHDIAKGPSPTVLLAELEGVSGRFFFRGKDKPTKKLTHDIDIAAELWDVSECLTAHAYLPD